MLNEQSKKSKRKAERRKKLGPRPNFPEGQASDDVTPAHNPHGTSEHGAHEERGKKKIKGAKPKRREPDLATIVRRTKSSEGRAARAKATMKRNLMAHTVYQDMGYLMAESLGLVSEAIKQMDPVPPYKKRGELAANAAAARKAGKKPAKSTLRNRDGSLKMPKNIKYPKGGCP